MVKGRKTLEDDYKAVEEVWLAGEWETPERNPLIVDLTKDGRMPWF